MNDRSPIPERQRSPKKSHRKYLLNPRIDRYTLLNDDMEDILYAIMQEHFFRQPFPMRNNKNPEMSKKYDYHQDYDHTIVECFKLIDHV